MPKIKAIHCSHCEEPCEVIWEDNYSPQGYREIPVSRCCHEPVRDQALQPVSPLEVEQFLREENKDA